MLQLLLSRGRWNAENLAEKTSAQVTKENAGMPLTLAESDFLAVYAFEYMGAELGPASRKLKERGFVYSDLTYLLEAYIRENGLQISKIPDDHGNLVEVEAFGRYDPNPPGPPWPDREAAQRRNAELLAEREAMKTSRGSKVNSPAGLTHDC